ncbi:MAG: Sec-independent protein translocase subunit TatB [Idiomarina sp.]|nr:Sec-independent protein translocase subunit TatB [Idiomarina sp.]
MFDIGFWELLLILVVGLLVLGPERLPRAVRSVQRSIAKFRAFSQRMEAEINHELRVKELHENLKKIEASADLDNLPPELQRSMKELQDAAASVRAPYAPDSNSGESQDSNGSLEAQPPPASAKKTNKKNPQGKP